MRSDSQRPPELEAALPISSVSSLMRGISSPSDRLDALDLDVIDPLKSSPKSVVPVRHKERGPPLSADLLSTERNRRSKSEER